MADADHKKELRKSQSSLKKPIDRNHQESLSTGLNSPKKCCQEMHEVQVLVEAVG